MQAMADKFRTSSQEQHKRNSLQLRILAVELARERERERAMRAEEVSHAGKPCSRRAAWPRPICHAPVALFAAQSRGRPL